MENRDFKAIDIIAIIATILVIVIILGLSIWLIVDISSFNIPKSELPDLQTMDLPQLNAEKLRVELRKLNIESNNLLSPIQYMAPVVSVLTVFVAVITASLTLSKLITEKERSREQKAKENRLELDQKVALTIKSLAEGNELMKISSAVSLITFLENDYRDYHVQLYYLLLNILKVVEGKTLQRLFMQIFEKSVRMIFPETINSEPLVKINSLMLDFTHTKLKGVDLSSLDLSGVDFAFAVMNESNLKNTKLIDARAYDLKLNYAYLNNSNLYNAKIERSSFINSRFDDASLINARIIDSDLMGAHFERTHLQSAVFKKSDLRNAVFTAANLNETNFMGIKFNSNTIKNIQRAINWENAYYDPQIKDKFPPGTTFRH